MIILYVIDLHQIKRTNRFYKVCLLRWLYKRIQQVEQRPVLAHLGPDGEVETDASYYDQIDPGLVEYWSGRIRKSYAYQSWWYERMKDAKVCRPTFIMCCVVLYVTYCVHSSVYIRSPTEMIINSPTK